MKTTIKNTTLLLSICVSAFACEQQGEIAVNEANARTSEPSRTPPPPPPTCQLERCYEAAFGEEWLPGAVGYAVEATANNAHPAIEVQGGSGPGARFESSGGEGVFARSHSTTNAAVSAHHAGSASAVRGHAVDASVASPAGVAVQLVNYGGGDLLRGGYNDGIVKVRIAGDGRLYSNGVELGKTGAQGPQGPKGDPGNQGPAGTAGTNGKSSGNFWCGQSDNCFNKCSGTLVGEADGECHIGGANGCSYGGTDGVCCACS